MPEREGVAMTEWKQDKDGTWVRTVDGVEQRQASRPEGATTRDSGSSQKQGGNEGSVSKIGSEAGNKSK